MNEVMKILKDEKLPQIDPRFDLRCKIKTHVRLSESDRIEQELLEIDTVRVTTI
jgi:hypothetical protein